MHVLSKTFQTARRSTLSNALVKSIKTIYKAWLNLTDFSMNCSDLFVQLSFYQAGRPIVMQEKRYEDRYLFDS